MNLIPLTKSDDKNAWVNFDNVTYMVQNEPGDTIIYFSTGSNVNTLVVKESPREIRDLLQESTASE